LVDFTRLIAGKGGHGDVCRNNKTGLLPGLAATFYI
jgi:hypothetical protein